MRPVPHPVHSGAESVWDHPRPPRVEHVDVRVTIDLGGERVVDTPDVVRMLETSHPPVHYLPISAFTPGALAPDRGASFCEFKGSVYAGPMDVCTVDGERVEPRPGGLHGGWITSNLAGPFKGAPGTAGW